MNQWLNGSMEQSPRRNHEELEGLLVQMRAELEQALSAPHPAGAPLLHLFDRLRERLEEHMRWEEEELFPAIEGARPEFALGPGRALRNDHEEIRRLQAFVAKHLRADPLTPAGLTRAGETVERVLAVFRVHERTEAAYIPRKGT
jgi:iron-sulfur cluster repair protein YtfE (RIC family)